MRLPDKLRAWIKNKKFLLRIKKDSLVYFLKKKLNIHCGSTRAVLVTKRYAFKFPRLKSLDQFFRGLSANQKERLHWKEAPDYFVPVLFSIPGLLVVMPTLKPFGENCPMVRAFMADLWHANNDNSNTGNGAWIARRYCEYINENYAMYKGKPMCIDYGTYVRADVNEQDFLKEMKWLVDKLDGKFEVIDEPGQSEVQVFGTSIQMDLELLDIPVFTANVESKGSELAHVVDDQQTTVEGQVPGQATRDYHRGRLGLGDYQAPTRIVQVKGYPLLDQKGAFAPTLTTIYSGNATLR
ncbi:hypothetical protein pETSU_126 [Edwardsiella phage pEt-SU]|uniref:Uncharacterized protein n=1 Tax=Edwardsiella phage pEt-SU TaxID=2562142 RepID=A0A4D6DWG1_9CAUD|nr:hypothetical protein HOV39_gp126 [Edwardsiella phage pEt-SU]QBZ70707.1 hypothetical protein pETSU_126 [Edwardsiella phage pEt-SU]